MRQKRKLAEHVWYQVRGAVTLLSSMARSLPPRRGAVFKQHPKHNKRLCLFRALLRVGHVWQRSNSASGPLTPIAEVTDGAAYTLADDDAGAYVRVVVSYSGNTGAAGIRYRR
jgi:hypothetical protein